MQITALGLRATPTGALTTIPTLATASTNASLVPQGSVMLYVQTSGEGNGTIVASPQGPVYSAGTVVTLKPVPGANSTFMGWSGACTGMGPCTLTMNSSGATAHDSARPAAITNPSVSVSAAFSHSNGKQYTLLAGAPMGGTVTPAPQGAVCGAGCWVYQPNVNVTLQASPATGFVFAGWSGDCTGMGACVVLTNANHSVTAKFMFAPPPSSLVFAPVSPPHGKVGVTYYFPFCTPATNGICGLGAPTQNPTGGVPPYSFFVGTGAFQPLGLSLDAGGNLTGIPVAQGQNDFSVCVSDTVGTEKCQSVEIVIDPGQPLAFTPVNPPNGQVGMPYSFSFCSPATTGRCGATPTTNPSGGVAPYTFTITNGQLPASLFLASNGTVSGTPTVAGTSAFRICAVDDVFHQQCQDVAITINNAEQPTLNSVTLSADTVTSGDAVTGTVTLSEDATGSAMRRLRAAAAAGGAIVGLQSSNAAAQVPGSVTVPAGQTSATFTVTTSAVSVQTVATITATLGDTAKTASLTVIPANTPVTLTVTESGTGSGTVVSSPAGINCPGACSWTYPSGTQVTLTANPATGSTFGGWSGACSGTGPCTVTMSANRSVAATFSNANGSCTGSPGSANCVNYVGTFQQTEQDSSPAQNGCNAITGQCTANAPANLVVVVNPQVSFGNSPLEGTGNFWGELTVGPVAWTQTQSDEVCSGVDEGGGTWSGTGITQTDAFSGSTDGHALTFSSDTQYLLCNLWAPLETSCTVSGTVSSQNSKVVATVVVNYSGAGSPEEGFQNASGTISITLTEQ